ncbi:MAG: DNA cytosine methyltransferase [Burkholderiales bacterium]|nr:MAG: DNA cytosine methyltransferase [Burkholderiales bacterium]
MADVGDLLAVAPAVAALRPDLVCGGPPCQGFSILGQRKLNDPRNELFLEFLRVAKDLRPKAVIIENVPGLATLEKGAVLRDIAAAFDDAGYNIDAAELVAAQYGVPQLRWRMMFVGWRKDLGRRGGFPAPTHGVAGIGDLVPNRTIPASLTKGFVTIEEAIGDLGAIGSGEVGYAYGRRPKGQFQRAMREDAPSALSNHYAPRLSEQNLERIRALKPGEDWRDLPHNLLPPGMQRAHRKDHTRRYRRMKWDGVARAIITRFRDPKSGEYTHPEQDRTISIREAARIQSFPDWFVFEGSHTEQYEQVGNAVPVLMARAIGREIAKMLTDAAEHRLPVKSRYRVPESNLNILDLVAAE